MSKMKDIKVGDRVFVIPLTHWTDNSALTLGYFKVTKVNNSSFYAISETEGGDDEFRFDRKTWCANAFPGHKWKAYESQAHFDDERYAAIEHDLAVAKVQAEAKNLTTEELKKTHEFMRSLMFAPNRKRKRQSK